MNAPVAAAASRPARAGHQLGDAQRSGERLADGRAD
jgi:hypothetical protein